ncbi:MAG: LAGLIDADG family homing endonuclease [Patescibacteria group bacterium]|nr:LAGLIDADG family homing endonuclease [Patescibacteria group bacterium]
MSDKAINAANQQGSLRDPSETTRQAPSIKAYLLGALHDGTFSSNKRFRISQIGTDWLKILQGLFRKLGYNSCIYSREGKYRKVYMLETLANFLDFNFNPLELETEEEKISYIKGFFDAKGGIPKNEKARFYIQLVQNDKEKLEKLKVLLNDLGIETGKIHNPSRSVDPDYWRMYIPAKLQQAFLIKIANLHPRKIKTLKRRMMI